MTKTLGELCREFELKATQEADLQVSILGVGTLLDANATQISFLTNLKYLKDAVTTRAAAVLATPEHGQKLASEGFSGVVLTTSNPYAAFARISQLFFKPLESFRGQATTAHIDASADIHPSAVIYPFAFVGPGAQIGAHAVVYAGAFVGAGATLGESSILYPNSVLREGCHVGSHCVLNPGAVVGGDGFGFAPDGMENVKIPQAGGVKLADYVEMGSNSSIDRGTAGNTTVGTQTKIDSLVQIGHNVTIGKANFICGLSGVAGSSRLGNRVTLTGQVGVSGHLSIADGVTVLAKSGVSKSITEAGHYQGIPVQPNREYLREQAILRRYVATYKKR